MSQEREEKIIQWGVGSSGSIRRSTLEARNLSLVGDLWPAKFPTSGLLICASICHKIIFMVKYEKLKVMTRRC